MLAAILLPALLSLGHWQLRRADEKRALLQQIETRRKLPAASLANLDTTDNVRYRYVRLQGQFDNARSFLLDNRVHNGHVGYDVLTPLNDKSGGWVLVNRGWIQAPARRDQLPDIPPVEKVVQVTGTVYQPLTDVKEWQVGQRWPKVVQTLHFGQLARELGETLQPFSVRLEDGMAGALVTGWPEINVQPQKHTAYAIQWFAMALALVILVLFASIKKSSATDRDVSL